MSDTKYTLHHITHDFSEVNLMQETVIINATTLLQNINGKKGNYNIHLAVDKNTGLCRFIKETPTKVSLRPIQLLQLISEVYRLIGFEPERKFVTFKINSPHPALFANDGKYYRLNKHVGGDWIENTVLPQLVRYLWDVSAGIDKTFHTLAYVYEDFPYTLLRLNPPSMWEISIQKD